MININRYTTQGTNVRATRTRTKYRKGTRVLLTEKPIKYRQKNEIQAVKTYEVFSNKHTENSTRYVPVMKTYGEKFAVDRKTDKTMVRRKKRKRR